MVDRRAPLLASFTLLLTCSIAAAGGVQIDGVYGNADGCAFRADPTKASENYQVVTAKEITNYGTGCEIVQMLPGQGTESVAVGLCGHEGEGYPSVEHFVLRQVQSEPPKLEVYMSSGDLWGEVTPCP